MGIVEGLTVGISEGIAEGSLLGLRVGDDVTPGVLSRYMYPPSVTATPAVPSAFSVMAVQF